MQKIIFALLIILSLATVCAVRLRSPGETEESAKLVFCEVYDEKNQQSGL